MNIYDDEGTNGLDLDKARAEVAATDHILDERIARRRYLEVYTAALLDVASSLRILAAEALSALPAEYFGEDDGAADEDPDAPRDFFLIGDLVHLVDDTEPGEVVKLGFDQGEAFADVNFANGHADRYYVRNLVRIIGDEAPADLAETIVEVIEGESVDLTVGPDDEVVATRTRTIEDDFEEAPELAALRERVGKSKKKGGK